MKEETYTCGEISYTVQEYIHKILLLKFVLIPPGSYVIGAADYKQYKHLKYAHPCHKVQIASFLISATVVPQRCWTEIMGTKPWLIWKESVLSWQKKWYIREGDDYPAVCISWLEAKDFCERTGVSLPSEAQWEYACRSGSTTKYYWGEKISEKYTWYQGNARSIQKIGEKKPNAFGLYDMSGNVLEWCEDTWHSSYNNAPIDGKAWIGNRSKRVTRGGSWRCKAGRCESAYRCSYTHTSFWCDVGFRVVIPLTVE